MNYTELPEPTCEALITELFTTLPEELRNTEDTIRTLGDCIWDIFSNNHTVHNEAQQAYDLGSFRGTGGFIVMVINKLNLMPEQELDYMDFYMGNIMRDREEEKLMPFYLFIFHTLKSKKLDWQFSFPRLLLISFKQEQGEEAHPENYDPATAVTQQLEKEQQEKEANVMQQQFDKIRDEEYEKAKYQKPSPEVITYHTVYGHWPAGHPLSEIQ